MFSGLSEEVIAAIQRERKNDRGAESLANKTEEEKKDHCFKENKWRRDRDVAESLEARAARRAKEAVWARNALANETPEHRAARLATKKRYRESEAPERHKARLVRQKQYEITFCRWHKSFCLRLD